jgi:tetratricopeptide (TPR) repeat protein
MEIKVKVLAGLLLILSLSLPSKHLIVANPASRGLQNGKTESALELIRRQRYDEAITVLEKILESTPNNGEALTFLATANLYRELNFTKAKKEFDEAFKAGGGATFFVTHSHEKLSSDEIVDYCRGWLHLRKDGVEFVAIESNHSFKLRYDEVLEFKQNRFSKKIFHIKVGEEESKLPRTLRERA